MSTKIGLFNRLYNFFRIQQNIAYLSLIVLLGTVLRLYNLGTESFWVDEIYTVYQLPQDLQTLLHQLITHGNLTRNATYFLLAHFWVLPFEITEVSIRSLSALFGILSIGVMYLVGQQLFGEKIGLLSSFFMAVSEFQIQHSQEARFYSLFVLLTLISLYCYILAFKTKQPRLWIISSLVNILLFYTHTYAIFVFAVEYFHYFIYWKNNKDTLIQWSISQIMLILAIAASLIPMLRERSVTSLGSGLSWIPVPSFKDLARTIYGYLFPQNYQNSWFFIGSTFAAGLAFFIIGMYFFNFRKVKKFQLSELSNWIRNVKYPFPVESEFVLVAAWFFLPIVVPFIYSHMFSPIFVDRYTICAAPAFYLLIAIGIARIGHVVPVSLILGALMIVVLPGLQDYYVADINEQWPEAAIYIYENSEPNDLIVFAPDDDGYQNKSFDWYYRGELPFCGISSNIKVDEEFEAAISHCKFGFERFWVVMRGPAEVVDHFRSVLLSPTKSNLRLVAEKQFVKVSVYLFESIK